MRQIIKNCNKTTESFIQLVSHVNCSHCSHLTDGAAQALLSSEGDVDPPLRTLQVRVLAGVGGVGPHGVRQLLLLLGRSDPPPRDGLRPVESHRDEAAAADLQLQPAAAEDERHGLPVGGRLHWQSADLQELVTRLEALQTHISCCKETLV